jgi:hypothetical protein
MSFVITAVAAVAYTIYSGERSANAQDKAQRLANANALKQEDAASQALNRANQKKPDTMAILSAAQQSGKLGASGTMLTGAQGVDPNALSLGKNTLLGG